MPEYVIDNRRVAKNTFLLYFRMILVTLINLYTVRLVLEVLGVEDYGIYNVVAGIVTSLSFLTSVLSSSTQRFYSYAIGEARPNKLKEIFNISLICYISIALLVVAIGETIGLWFVKTQLTIPSDRLQAATYAYQFSILSFVLTMIQVPFSSLTIAKEDMNIWSIISIAEAVLKLLFALLLPYIAFDHLTSYGASLSIIWLLALVSYIIICRIKYSDICIFDFKLYDYKVFKQMITFSGWTMYGSLAGVGLNQGITIIINVCFGPIINTARAIGLQIESAIGQFCGSFITAIKPPVIKCYASNNIDKVIQLFYLSNKILYYSAIVICIPLFLEVEYVLTIWLKEASDYMIIFSRYSIIFAVLLALHNPITIFIEATGDVRKYRVLVESLTLLAMPITWIVYKCGGTPEATYFVSFTVFGIAQLIRVKVLSEKIQEITIVQYIKKFVLQAIMVTLISIIVLTIIQKFMLDGFVRLFIICLLSVFIVGAIVFTIALSKEERKLLFSIIKNGKKNI